MSKLLKFMIILTNTTAKNVETLNWIRIRIRPHFVNRIRIQNHGWNPSTYCTRFDRRNGAPSRGSWWTPDPARSGSTAPPPAPPPVPCMIVISTVPVYLVIYLFSTRLFSIWYLTIWNLNIVGYIWNRLELPIKRIHASWVKKNIVLT